MVKSKNDQTDWTKKEEKERKKGNKKD